MDPDADLAAVGRLIGDPHRAQMLLALLGGTPQTGSALASAVGISRSLASAHLKKLTAGGLVSAQRSGRQQMYSIAQPLADALEILVLFAQPAPVRSLREATRMRSLRWARMCYDHLAGTVGVAVTETIIARGALREQDGGYVLAPDGAELFGAVGIDTSRLPRRGRPLVRPCMDWSERRYHLAGSLGAALAASMIERGWLRPQEGSRIVIVTPAGVSGLADWLGIDLERLRAVA